MFNTIALVVMYLGQTQCGAPVYINYKMGDMQEYTRQYINIPYKDGSTKRVPVINGYVPGIRHYQHWGSDYELVAETIVYDYTIWQTYEEVMAKWRKKWAEEKAKEVRQPRTLPKPVVPKPILPKPEPTPVPPEIAPLNLVPILPQPGPFLPPKPDLPALTNPYRPVDPPTESPRVVLPPTYRER